MEKKVSSVYYIFNKHRQHIEERRAAEKNQAIITVDPSDEDRDMGLRIERAGKKVIQGIKEIHEYKVENVKKLGRIFRKGSQKVADFFKSVPKEQGVYHITNELYAKYIESRQEENK